MLLPSLLEAKVRTETHSRLAGFHPEVARRWGTLSPGGVLCHLARSYEIAAGLGFCSERTGPLQRSVFRYLALHVPLQWAHGYQTLPELAVGGPGVQPQDFGGDHARLLAAYDTFLASNVESGRAHPIFGPLTTWEWMRWGYLHADHHLRQFGL